MTTGWLLAGALKSSEMLVPGCKTLHPAHEPQNIRLIFHGFPDQ